jgi:hypothetical protein
MTKKSYLCKGSVIPIMFEKQIDDYEKLAKLYYEEVVSRMDKDDYLKYSEVVFSAHSCAECPSYGCCGEVSRLL